VVVMTGLALIVLGLGNAALGWAVGRSVAPRLRQLTTRLEVEDPRHGRWPKTAHGLDRFNVRFFEVISSALVVIGLLIAGVGLVVLVVGS
jgi:hypothetical protein